MTMTMPGARKITIGDRTYAYVLKSRAHPRSGWTNKEIRLVVELQKGRYVSVTFESKLWTVDHEDHRSTAPAHKASFTPADVHNVIETLEFHKGEMPARFETGTWKRTISLSQRNVVEAV